MESENAHDKWAVLKHTEGMKRLRLPFVLLCACADDIAPLEIPTENVAIDGGLGPVTDAAGSAVDAGVQDAFVDVYVPPPMPQGCIADVSSGDRTYSCEGLTVNASIPDVCQKPGCGLILQLHGDTGTGPLVDGHTQLHTLGKQKGYVVISPNGRSNVPAWTTNEDAKLVKITTLFRDVFRVDAKKVHVTGFSRGGFAVWRLVCQASDLFASAAPGAAGNGNGEVTCFSNGRTPAQKMDLLFLMGRTDVPVPFSTMTSIRDNARSNYGTGAVQVVKGDAKYTHNRWTSPDGVVIETFEHGYETVPNGPWGSSKGHCFPGSTSDPFAPQYAVPCQGPNAFTWGQEVMNFFVAHPKR